MPPFLLFWKGAEDDWQQQASQTRSECNMIRKTPLSFSHVGLLRARPRENEGVLHARLQSAQSACLSLSGSRRARSGGEARRTRRGILLYDPRAMVFRAVVAALLLAAIALFAGAGQAQNFPSKSVRLILWGAGSFPDLVARRMADRLAAKWGRPVVVENRAGAAGILAAEVGVQAPADGHTLVWGDPVGWALFLQNEADRKGGNATASLVPVSMIVDVPMVLFVNSRLPVNTLQEFLQYARTAKEPLFYGTPGVLSIHHLTLELLASRTGIRMQHAPFKGMVQITQSVVAGDVAAAVSGLGSIAGFLKDGRIRGLAWTGPKRFQGLPHVPTFAEAGVPDFVVGIKAGFFAHKDTPRELLMRLSRDLSDAARSPDVVEFVSRAGAVAVGSTPEEFAQAAQRDIELFGRIAKEASARGK